MVSLDQTLRRGLAQGAGGLLLLAVTGSMALAQPQTPPSDASRKPALRTAPEPVCRVVIKTRIVKVPRMILKNGVVFGTVDRQVDDKYLSCQPAA